MLTREQVENIVFLRKKGYTQQQIANEIGISRQTVSYQLKKVKNNDTVLENEYPDEKEELIKTEKRKRPECQ